MTGLMLCALPAFAAKAQHVDQVSGVLAPSIATINGAPLRIVVGDEHSYQIFNSSIPGVGQMFPPGSAGTADMGWMVRVGSDLYAPDYAAHPSGSATGSLGIYTAFTPTGLSAVSGAGSAANPYRVTVTSALGGTGIVASEEVSYVDGQNYFEKQFTLTNNGAASQEVRIFLGGDIYLAGDDRGIPYLEAASSSPGGKDCGTPAEYFILFIPQTPANAFTGSSYTSLWSQIGGGQLDSALAGTSCIDNAAGLQWNRTLAAGTSVTIRAATSFGDVPELAQFGIASVNPGSALQGATVNVTITGFGFESATTFGFGAGITLSGLSILDANTATATLTIAAAAALGFRDVVATQTPGGLTATLANGFQVTDQGGGTPGVTPPVAVPVSGLSALALLVLSLVLAGAFFARRRVS
ncbi:MAG: hypothetical protein ABIY56_10655 [Dokdonella sp.]